MLRERNARLSLCRSSARGTGFSFSTSIGAVAATRTDSQLSRRWFKIPAPRMSGAPQSRPHSRAPTLIRATSCPSTSSVTASGFPSAMRAARRSVSIPRRWKTTAWVAHRGSLPSILTEWSFRINSPSTSIDLSERSLKTDQLPGDGCDACALFLKPLDRKRKHTAYAYRPGTGCGLTPWRSPPAEGNHHSPSNR